MYAPKQNQKANTQSNLWQQTATAERVTSDAQSIASIQRDPLVQQTSQMINGPNANAHAGILNLAPANQQSSNQQLLLQWQQQYGNSYVNQVLQLAQQMRGGTSANKMPKPVVQAKLTVNRVGDKYEQEADRVAAQVVQQINAPAVKVSDAKDGAIQREAIPENEKEQDQQPELAADKPKTMPSKLEEDHLVQMKPQGQDTVSGDGRGVTSEMEASIQQAQGKGEPLPDKIRKQMEQAFGADFGGVSIHVDTEADEMNQSLQARAFTVGQDIFFRKGAYDPNSKQGQELLAHELTHVVQQNGSEAQPTADQDMLITKSPQNTGVQRLCSQCDQKKEKGVIQAKEVPGGTPGATVEGEASVSPISGQVLPKDSDPDASSNTPQSDSSLCPPPPPDSNNGSDCTEKPSACSTGNTGSTPEDGADGETESLPSKSIPKTQPRQTSLPRKNSSNLRPQSRGKVVGSKTIPQNTQATTTDPEAADHPDLENQVEAANRGVVRQKAEATAQALKAQVQLHTINAETSWLTSTEINFALPQQKKTAAREDNSVKQQQQRAIATSMASSFLAQGAMHVQKVTALGQEILVQIQEESKGVVASVKATIEQQKAAVATQMSGQRDQAQSEAEKTIAHIHTRYQVTRAAIPQKATKVRQQTETEYAKALFTINEGEREQLDQINKSYVEVCGQCKNVGQMIGAEAVAFGEEKATYWDKQKIHRDDNFGDGPLTDNRLQAKMDAAKKVAAQFKCSLINEANQQADEIQKQKPKDIQIAHTIAEQHRQQAQILQQHSLENLSGVEEQGISQVTEAQIKLTETANQSLQSTLQFLNQEEAVQLQVLEGYGQRQILAIERDAQKAIASLQNGVNEVAASLQNVLENSIAQFQEMEAPNPEELSVTLANTLQRFDNAVVMVQRQTEKGIATSKFSAIEGGKQAVDAVTAIAQRGVEESATVVEETLTALSHLKKGTTHTFNEIQRGHTKTFTKSIEIAVKGFSQLKEGIQTTFEQYLKPDRFQQSLTSLEEGLRGGIHGYKGQSEECAIKYAADKAADQVQPRWKVALKWIIIILVAIITIVVMVVFPPGGGLLGALLVGVLIGAVTGIVVQIINNAIDGKKWSDGVGQAALAGAIGGLLGGIGGVVGQAVKIGVNIAKEVVKKALVFAVRFGIDQVFNALGTLVGDLAVAAIDHQPIDWKEIGKDIGIGAAMGVGSEGLGGAAHRSLAGISNRAKVAEFGQKHPGEIGELAKLDPKNQEAFDEGVNKVAERTGMKPQEIAELAKLKQVHHAERAIRITKKFDKYRLGRFIKQRAIKTADMHQEVEPETPADATEVTKMETIIPSEPSSRHIPTANRPDDVAGVKHPETEEKAPDTTDTTTSSTLGNKEAAPYQVLMKTLDGKTKILHITAETKISELKKDLGYESIDGYLISGGKVLRDELTVADYPNIQELSTIEFRGRLRGGMESPGKRNFKGAFRVFETEDYTEQDKEFYEFYQEKVGGSDSIVIAVLDTGIKATSDYLRDHVVAAGDYSSSSEFQTYSVEDIQDLHGTKVAGQAAYGTDKIKLVDVRVQRVQIGSGDNTEEIAKGITWAVENYKAKVITCSVDLKWGASALQEVVKKYPDVLFLTSAGNQPVEMRERSVDEDGQKKTNAMLVGGVTMEGEKHPSRGFGSAVDVLVPSGTSNDAERGLQVHIPEAEVAADLIKNIENDLTKAQNNLDTGKKNLKRAEEKENKSDPEIKRNKKQVEGSEKKVEDINNEIADLRDLMSSTDGVIGSESGVSFGIPVIANIAAKMLLINPALSASDIKTILTKLAVSQKNTDTAKLSASGGIVDPVKAYQEAANKKGGSHTFGAEEVTTSETTIHSEPSTPDISIGRSSNHSTHYDQRIIEAPNVVAEQQVSDGTKIKISQDGDPDICSSPCKPGNFSPATKQEPNLQEKVKKATKEYNDAPDAIKTAAPKKATNRVDTGDTPTESVSDRESSVQESGFIESDQLSLQQVKNEEDYISEHPEIVKGTTPNKSAKIGEHEWREEENGTACRRSDSSVCSDIENSLSQMDIDPVEAVETISKKRRLSNSQNFPPKKQVKGNIKQLDLSDQAWIEIWYNKAISQKSMTAKRKFAQVINNILANKQAKEKLLLNNIDLIDWKNMEVSLFSTFLSFHMHIAPYQVKENQGYDRNMKGINPHYFRSNNHRYKDMYKKVVDQTNKGQKKLKTMPPLNLPLVENLKITATKKRRGEPIHKVSNTNGVDFLPEDVVRNNFASLAITQNNFTLLRKAQESIQENDLPTKTLFDYEEGLDKRYKGKGRSLSDTSLQTEQLTTILSQLEPMMIHPSTDQNYHDFMLAERGQVADRLGEIIQQLKGDHQAVGAEGHPSLIIYNPKKIIKDKITHKESIKGSLWEKDFLEQMNNSTEEWDIFSTLRDSFGFPRPTVSDVAESVRLWLGFAPEETLAANLKKALIFLDRTNTESQTNIESETNKELIKSNSHIHVEALKTAVRHTMIAVKKKADNPSPLQEWLLNRLIINLHKAKYLLELYKNPETNKIININQHYLKTAAVIEKLQEYAFMYTATVFNEKDKAINQVKDPYETYLSSSNFRFIAEKEHKVFYLDSGMQALNTATILAREFSAQKAGVNEPSEIKAKENNPYFEYPNIKTSLNIYAKASAGLQNYIVQADLSPVLTKPQSDGLKLTGEKHRQAIRENVSKDNIAILDVTNAPLSSVDKLMEMNHQNTWAENFILVESLTKHQQIGADKFIMGRMVVVGSDDFIKKAEAVVAPIAEKAHEPILEEFRRNLDAAIYGDHNNTDTQGGTFDQDESSMLVDDDGFSGASNAVSNNQKLDGQNTSGHEEADYQVTKAQLNSVLQYDLAPLKIKPDGDCLFSAILASQSQNSTKNISDFRNEIAEKVNNSNHKNDYASNLKHLLISDKAQQSLLEKYTNDFKGKTENQKADEIENLSNDQLINIITTEITTEGSFDNAVGDMTPQIISTELNINIIIHNEDGSTTSLASEERTQTIHLIRVTTPLPHYYATRPIEISR